MSELSCRIVSGAFDGEYFHLSVPSHLLNMLLVRDEGRKWYTFQWDPAHILELAEKDSMNNSSCNSVKNVISTISDVSKSFSHGKSFRELLEEAASSIEEGDESEENPEGIGRGNARTPGHFSDTRFATYCN